MKSATDEEREYYSQHYFYHFSKDEERDGVRAYNHLGIEMSPDEALNLAKDLLKYYGSFDEEEQNELAIKKIEDEINKELTWYGSPYYYKEFNRNKRNWSFKCFRCEQKVSSKEDDGYYLFTVGLLTQTLTNRRTCSRECAEDLVDEVLAKVREERYADHGIEQK